MLRLRACGHSLTFRLPKSIGFHHVLIAFNLIAIVLLAILLAGCTSASAQMPGIYLLSLSYSAGSSPPASPPSTLLNPQLGANLTQLAQNASLAVRTAFIGTCIQLPPSPLWECANDVADLVPLLSPQDDPLNILYLAQQFKAATVFFPLFVVTIVMNLISAGLMCTFPSWHEEIDDDGSEKDVKPFPSRPISQLAMGACAFGAIFALLSAFWQHIASIAAAVNARALLYGTVDASVGPTIMGLGWAAFAATSIPAAGLLVMIISIDLLSRLTDDM